MSTDRSMPEAPPVAGVDLGRPSLAGLVERSRLLELLDRSTVPLVLLTAPSGYGKSVLLAQWAARDPRPFASLTLGEVHNDPVLLLEWVFDALDRIEPLPPGVAAALSGPSPDVERAVLPTLAGVLASRRRGGVLVLDELEHLESPHSLAVVATLAENARPGTQIAVATRVDPALPLGKLRARRLLVELGRDEQAMTAAEGTALLEGLGLRLAPAALDALLERTEGWPAALYLAGRALLEEEDPSGAVARFAGDDRLLADYIRDEFLAGLSDRRLEFLRRVSILDRFSAELCDAVLGRSGSATVLRDLVRGNMLMLALDRRDEWFRLHALLAEMLRAELRVAEPELEPELHGRASRWWEGQGDADRAIVHAIEARDFERAGTLLWQAVPEYNARGRVVTVTRWLDRLGAEQIADYPTLSVSAAHGALSRGEGSMAGHWIAVSRVLVERLDDSERGRQLRAGLALAEAGLGCGGVAGMRERAAAAAELMDEDNPWISMCRLLEGTSLVLSGRGGEARERLTDGARRAAVGVPNIQVLCLAQLGLLAAEAAEWREALELIAQARAQATRAGLSEYPSTALPFAASALVRSQLGHDGPAAADLSAALRLVRRLEQFAPWFEARTRIVLARAAARLGQVELARELLGEARPHLADAPDATMLPAWLAEAEAEAEAISAARLPDLTPAELRVLRMLHTHHSLPQIAAQFNVSTNTVKTQAQAVYRKLGVRSRREAVERARAVGLFSLRSKDAG
jgi:LuxR family transcriptional regulator, maltose regulon positive regulatory protein